MNLQLTSLFPKAAESKAKSVSLSDATFGKDFNEPLVHQVVVAYQAGARQGSRAQKTRAEVQGGGRKPYRQKGTGRSRAGTLSSPIRRGGGVTFAAKPGSHAVKVNRKMYRSAMRSILSELLRQERLLVVEDFKVKTHKTSEVRGQLEALPADRMLLVVEEVGQNLYLGARNLPYVEVIDVEGLNPVNLIGHDKTVFTLAALRKTEERLA